jgi:lipopolysaccharide transport system ATP-binding protein
MAGDVVIRAEGLGKKYVIGHLAQHERNLMLRDVLACGARDIWHKTADMLRGRAIVSGDTTEELWALEDVSFQVKRGEVLGVIGHNGAGKSTLLKILSRITEPSEGRVTIEGRVASLLEVGTGFHPELSGRENIYLNGAILGMRRTEIRRKFDEIVAFAEIEKFLDTPVKRYSSGMYVRLAFAVAAHLEPEILLVDEVLAVGDIEFQKKCMGKMKEVSGEGGRTVLFVSHNLAAVQALTEKALILESGRTRFLGPTSAGIEVYTRGNAKLNGQQIIRAGGRHTRVLEVNVLDENGSPSDRYCSASPLVLDVILETDGAKGMSFDVYIVNGLGQRIYYYTSNLFEEVDIPTSPGRYRFRLNFKPLLLASGEYSIDLATAVTNVAYDNYVAAAAAFRVSHFNPTGNFWDFRGMDGYGMVALSSDVPVSVSRL